MKKRYKIPIYVVGYYLLNSVVYYFVNLNFMLTKLSEFIWPHTAHLYRWWLGSKPKEINGAYEWVNVFKLHWQSITITVVVAFVIIGIIKKWFVKIFRALKTKIKKIKHNSKKERIARLEQELAELKDKQKD